MYMYIYIYIYIYIYGLHANNLNLIAITRGSSDTHEEVFDGHQKHRHECNLLQPKSYHYDTSAPIGPKG